MKCNVCAKEIPEGSRFCGACGQPVSGVSELESVQNHWKAVGEDTARYEDERQAAAARIRKESRRIRVRWVVMTLILVGLVAWLGFTDSGKGVTQNTLTYANAWWDMEEGRYQDAYVRLLDADWNFPGVQEGIYRCEAVFREEQYDRAGDLFAHGDYHGALYIYQELGDYRNAPQRVEMCLDAIRAVMAPPAIQWTFAEGMDGTGGMTWKNSGAEWMRVVDSQISRALYFDNKDKMTSSTGIMISEEWSVSVQLANLDTENRNVLSMYGSEGEFDSQLYIRDNRLVWIQTLGAETVELDGGWLETPGSRWYDVTLSRKGDVLTLYVDGVLKSSIRRAAFPRGEHEVTLHLGNWDHQTKGTAENGSFLGFIGELSLYDYGISEVEALLRYEPEAYNATHLWDTSFPFLEEDNPEQSHFLFLYLDDYGDHLCMAMLHRSDLDDIITLNWDKDYGILDILNSDSLMGYDLYYLEDGIWNYISYYEGFHAIYNVTKVISSDLMIYTNYGEEILPVMIGGRG